MQVRIYGWLTKLPAQFIALLGWFIGVIAGVWPNTIRGLVEGGSTEQIYATSTLALAVVSIYFFLLWFLKPAIVPRHENFQVARRLTAPQKSKLKQALIGQFVTDNFALIRDNSSRKALIFAQDFDEVFTSSGWNVGQAGLSGVAQFPPSGIGMVIRDTANIGANMKTVMAALDAAGIPFDIMTDLPAPVGDGLYVTDPE